MGCGGKIIDTIDKLEELMEFAVLDGTEWGEMLQSLGALYEYRTFVSKELATAIDAEIISNHEWAIANLQIITETEMVPRITKRLEEIE